MKVVVTGGIGAGKSTVVRAAMSRLGWERPAGFFTHWGGAGRGADVLHIETWGGERRPMARRVAAPAGPGGAPYELDGGFAPFAAAALAAAGPVVIDELGGIELGSGEFVAEVVKGFAGPGPVLAVIQRRALERWLDLLGRDRVGRVVEVEPAGRDGMPAEIAALFRG